MRASLLRLLHDCFMFEVSLTEFQTSHQTLLLLLTMIMDTNCNHKFLEIFRMLTCMPRNFLEHLTGLCSHGASL